jgi:hypothetical protein
VSVRPAPHEAVRRSSREPSQELEAELPRERLFTRHTRKVLRKRITLSETVFGIAFIALVGLATIWIGAQGDNFDPADRDLSFEVLEEQSTDATLYNPPLERWTEPGTAATGLPSVNVAPFPPAILEDGWSLDGRVESYDASNVYEKINGAAEQYISFGFRSLHYATIAKEPHFLTIELYDQEGFRNVLGIFAAQRGKERKVESSGEIFFYPTQIGMIGGYRNFYFKIAGNSGHREVLEKAGRILGVVAELPAVRTPAPRPFRILTQDLGVRLEDLVYQRSDVFQYDFLSDFWFGAVTDHPGASYFMHEAGDAGSADILYRRLRKEQESEYSLVEDGSERVLLRHEYLKTYFALQRGGDMLYGVAGASSREAAKRSLSRLRGALTDESSEEANPEA